MPKITFYDEYTIQPSFEKRKKKQNEEYEDYFNNKPKKRKKNDYSESRRLKRGEQDFN